VAKLLVGSGGLLLKFHWASVSAQALKAMPVNASALHMITVFIGDQSWIVCLTGNGTTFELQ
jgi:hypothetical protein